MHAPSPSEAPAIKSWDRSSRLVFAICVPFVGLLLAGSWWAWRRPPVEPVHPSARAFLFMAPVFVAIFSLAALPKNDRVRARLRLSSRGLLPVWLGLFLLYAAGFHLLMILAVIGRPVHSAIAWLLGPMGLLLVVLGNNLGKCRDDFFFRIRTPWTTRSELSWNRTNRLGARMFVVFGLVFCAGAFLDVFGGLNGKWFAVLICICSLALNATFWAYSYVWWRRDPEKTACEAPNPGNSAGSNSAGSGCKS
jgi:hypothetical protein